MNRCPLFVELCAGTVAVSLRLQGGNRCRPVVSRMGAKTGYANVILACFGLTPGGKADAYLWCEPDPGARLLLQALPQPDILREAASVLRGWASEDPRTLWESLRKEGAPKGVDGREVARWSYVVGASWKGEGIGYRSCETSGGGNIPITVGGIAARVDALPSLPPTTITEDARTVDPREVARWCLTSAWSNGMGAAYCGPDRPSSCHPPGWVASITAQGVADRCAALPSLPPTTITEDARTVDPREVARWCAVAYWSFRKGQPESGFNKGAAQDTPRTATHHGGAAPTTTTDIAQLLHTSTADWPPVAVTSDAREIDPPLLPVGTVCLIDPPYVQTTGYGHELPRAEVVRLARLWADAGAFVGVCEQEPIPELIADGWHAVDITHGRKGQKRTFSKQQHEFLTLNRPPVNPPLLGVQEDLW